MKKLYIWEATTMLDNTNTLLSYPMSFKVVTDDKSFSKAESAAIAHISTLMGTNDYHNRTWVGYLSTLQYIDYAIMTMEETDGQSSQG